MARIGAPTLELANKRRYWLVFTMIIENLFFSAVLLGWSSLLPVLLEEGFFSNSCLTNDDEEKFTNATLNNATITQPSYNSNDSIFNEPTYVDPPPRFGRPEYPRCAEQDASMNLAFTVGSFLLSGLTFPIGMAMDKFGCRVLRMIGSLMFIASCLLFGWATVDTSWLLYPAVSLNGVGGIIHTFTAFQVANLFGHKRSTIISLNIGSYASAAILFLILKALYDLGISRQYIFTGVAIACVFVIVNCYINVPMEPIPDPEGATFGMHWNILGIGHKVTGQKFINMVQTVGRRLSVDNENTKEDIFPITYQNMNRRNSKMFSSHERLPTSIHFTPKKSALSTLKEAVMPLIKSVWSPIYMLSIVTMCVVQLRLLFFIGSLSQMLYGIIGDDKHTVDKYVYLFGIMQLMCLVTSPMIGAVMDYKIKETLANARKEKELQRKNSMARSSLQNGAVRRNHSTGSFTAPSQNDNVPFSVRRNQSTGSFMPSGRTLSTGSYGNGTVANGHGSNGVVSNGVGNGRNMRRLSLGNIKAPSSPSNQDPSRRISRDQSPRRKPSRTRHLSLGSIKLKPEDRERMENKARSASEGGSKPRRFSLVSLRGRRNSSSSSIDSMKPPMSLKIRKLINGSWAFGITSILLMVFGFTVLIENLHVQVLSFVLHTIIRGFIHSACCGLYAITYPANQVGSLIGLQSMISACATLLQYPIFIAIEDRLNGDPWLVNIVLLACSVLSFGLPVYMLYLGKKMRREQKEEAEKNERLLSQSSKTLEPLLEDGIEEHSEDGSEDVFLDEPLTIVPHGSAMV